MPKSEEVLKHLVCDLLNPHQNEFPQFYYKYKLKISILIKSINNYLLFFFTQKLITVFRIMRKGILMKVIRMEDFYYPPAKLQ